MIVIMTSVKLSIQLFIATVFAFGCNGPVYKTDHNIQNKDSMQASSKTENDFSKSGYADVNGITMYYEIHGTGNPLVLIHGGGSTIESTFGKILPVLAKTHKVIAIELQAHGRTSDRNTPESFMQDANDVSELLHQLNIDSANILGFSNGGQTAMQLALSHPEKVKRLILASAFYKRSGVPEQFWKSMDQATFNDMPHPLKDAFLKVKDDSTALLNMFKKDLLRMQNFKGWTDEDIKAITAPTLIISGDNDVLTVEHAVEMHRLIAHSQLAIIPGGHGKYLGEVTTLTNGKWTQDYIASLLQQFLDGSE